MTQPKAADLEEVRLPLTFILTGISIFVLAQLLLLDGVDQLILGTAQVPYLLAVAHLLVLGFGTMVAMGVMYQLVPVALQTKIHDLRVARYQYGIYLIGVLGICWSFIDFSAFRLLIFASVTVLGILLFEWNLWLTIRNAASSEIRTAIGSALTSLLVTIGLGLWLVIDFYHPHMGAWHARILPVHILFGMVGWFTMLIVGFSYKLAPMFTLSHGYKSHFGKWAVYLLDAGLAVTSIGILLKEFFVTIPGVLLLIAGFVSYGIQLKKILNHRLRKKYDPGVAAALFAMPFTLCLSSVVGLEGWLTGENISFSAIVYLIIMGWIALTILGYLYKIIPFLWWTHKYGKVIGKQKTPNLKEMLDEKRGKVWLFLLFSAVCLNTAGVTFDILWLGWVGQTTFFTIGLFYVLELILVLRK